MHRIYGMVLLVSFALRGAAAFAADPGPVTLADLQLGPEFTQHLISVPGGRVACYRRSGTGPTLLLIPETFADRRAYAWTVRSLDAALDLIILENRGLGDSGLPPAHSSIESCAQDAIEVLNALQVEFAYVGGHSLGGMIALEMGRQWPHRVRGVISIEGWTNATVAADAFQGDMKSTLSTAQQALLQEYRKEVLQHWSPEQIQMFGSIWRNWDGSSFLKTTTLPVLELYGDRGKPHPERNRLGIPENDLIQLKWFEGASHSLLIERPEAVAHAANQFIAETSRSRVESEVVIVGGTPAGIAAALAAARRGRTVLLVESHDHLGGMMTSGLGKSDVEHRKKMVASFWNSPSGCSRTIAQRTGPITRMCECATKDITTNLQWPNECSKRC